MSSRMVQLTRRSISSHWAMVIDATLSGLWDEGAGLPRVALGAQPWAGLSNPVGVDGDGALGEVRAGLCDLF